MNVEELQDLMRGGEQVEYLFFWGHRPGSAPVGPWVLSQWYEVSFVVDGLVYRSAEHYMMARKAAIFGDEASVEKILAADHPSEAKALGRAVTGFDDVRWVEHRSHIVVEGNLAKFGQNEPLRRYLLDTGDRVLVEAAPRDCLWGIGLGAKNLRARDPSQWRGLNLLGFALMEVREQLRAGAG